MSSEWIIGHPSDNKHFVATVVVASLLLTAFVIGIGVMLYFWVKSWRECDAYNQSSPGGMGEKGNSVEDLEAGRATPHHNGNDESDESPIVGGMRIELLVIVVCKELGLIYGLHRSFKMAS